MMNNLHYLRSILRERLKGHIELLMGLDAKWYRKLIAEGRFYDDYQQFVYPLMESNQCYSNVKKLVDDGLVGRPVFGLGLWTYPDFKEWKFHAWYVDENKLLETSAIFESYYGIELKDEEFKELFEFLLTDNRVSF